MDDGARDTDSAGRLLSRSSEALTTAVRPVHTLYDIGSNVVSHEAIGVDDANGADSA